VAGLLFLHNILNSRWTNPPGRPILKEVGADNTLSKVIFVTTHWDQIELKPGAAREMQFRHRVESLLRLAVRMDRFDKKTETAWRILEPLLR